MKTALRIGLCLFALLGLAAGQSTASRWSSSKALGFGRVDRATLNNHFEIPIYSRATVGNAQIRLRLSYDSNFWSAPAGGTGYWSPGAGFGWRLVQPFGAIATQANQTDVYCGYWNDNKRTGGIVS